MSARLAEIEAAIQAFTQQLEMAKQKVISLTAARDEIRYWMDSWSEDVQIDMKDAMSLASYAVKERGALLEKSTGAAVVSLEGKTA